MKYTAEDRLSWIIKILIDSQKYVTVEEIVAQLGVSARSVYYTLDEVKAILLKGEQTNDISVYGKGILLNQAQRDYLSYYYAAHYNVNSLSVYSLTQEERAAFMYCEMFAGEKRTTIKSYENIFYVSNYTVSNDMSYLRNKLAEFDLEVLYSHEKGYFICGNSFIARKMFYNYFSLISPAVKVVNGAVTRCSFINKDTEAIYGKLQQINTSFLYYRSCLLALSCVINGLQKGLVRGLKPKHFENPDVLRKEVEEQFIEENFPDLPLIERQYLSTYLYCSSSTLRQCDLNRETLNEIVKKMNNEITAFCSAVIDDEAFNDLLAQHLELVYLRYVYGLSVENRLLKEIKEKYAFFYLMARKVSIVIERELNTRLPDNEIGFLALYYAGYFRRYNHKQEKVSVVAVCNDGLATRYLLRSELERIDSRIRIADVVPYSKFQQRKEEFEGMTVISCLEDIKIEGAIKIHSIMSNADRLTISNEINRQLLNNVSRYSNLNILNIVQSVIKNNDYRKIIKAMNKSSLPGDVVDFSNTYLYFKQEFVQMVDDPSVNLNDLVRIACDPLIKERYIGEQYCDMIIGKLGMLEQQGMINNGYLLVYGEKEYSDKMGISFVKCNFSLEFAGSPIKGLFVITPQDQKDHLYLINTITTILNNAKLRESIEKADDLYELYLVLTSAIANGSY